MRTILLTGVSGQVGWELRRTLATQGKVVAVDSQSLDLTNFDAIRHLVRKLRPDIIVNPAAYSAVDKAESEPDLAYAINRTAPEVLAEEAKNIGALLVHYSTDYVFDGKLTKAYTENDEANPGNVYGRSKLEGDLAVCTVNPAHLVFRTSWVYGTRGRNFLKTMIKLGRERESLKVVNDQIGAPTWSRLIAEATAMAISRFQPELSGVYHLTNSGKTSWHGFACAIMDGYAERVDSAGWPELRLNSQSIAAIASEQYPTPAKRPLNSVMNTTKFKTAFGVELPDWHESLELVLDDLTSQYQELKNQRGAG